ncbi:hypothetical protein Thimo_2902 [Thioflavicoccus mobilis 8321]|uniref:Copper chaperone n=1 Tax=Thioflavicoccus mobilis 8321 TaxID=765912 RepID=L0GXW7_9GAMM|nr:hypothetical protein [Thioflavicoccus mobilis]AGA91598.1 hypothetical protein Thimo_2902 [Thioflavicoccus mobilis 8321]
MSLYIHHVPGRLRVRTQALRCKPGQIDEAVHRLTALEGVQAAAVNRHAGSITVHYDPKRHGHEELLDVLRDLGCVDASASTGPASGRGEIAGLFGRALIGAVAQTLAQRSVQTLVGVALR